MKQPRYSKSHGATLLEVLIALVILALGVLGMMALQTTSLKVTRPR